jgi:glutamine cyclotransferase
MREKFSFCSVTCLFSAFWYLLSLAGCSNKMPPVISPEIAAEIPHDSTAFVQGLFYDAGRLFESDGLYGQSALRMLDAQSGALLKHVPLEPRYFGEGCAKMGETVVQLTWQEKTALTWSLADLSPGPALLYGGEGWGLTGDGTVFYLSNGSDTVFVRDTNFTVVRKIQVTLRGMPVKNLNELEYVNGVLYANVWYSDSIFAINPKSGKVERIIDCSRLVEKEGPSSSECVLNGIAYNSETRGFYLTGKNWKKIFLVTFGPSR